MSRAVEHFMTELDLLIDRFRQEYDMSYAELVGSLEIKKADIISETHLDDEVDLK